MNKSLEQILLEHNDDLISSDNNQSVKLNKILASFLNWPLQISSGTIADISGAESDIFNSIIHTSSDETKQQAPSQIISDRVGCVIETIGTLTIDNFRQSYNKIAKAKAMPKNQIEQKNGVPRIETLGVILATCSDISFEEITKEFRKLNEDTHPSSWPDIIAILSLGIIHYACQFPGENKINTFLLPSIKNIPTSIPAFYLIPIASPTAKHTFNNVCSIIFGHLNLFSPGSNLPNPTETLGKKPTASAILPGYQFNLKGELKPVSPEFYIGKYLPDEPNIFKDKKHDISFSLQYMPWQDGGVIFLIGKMPLEGLLIFIGNKVKNRLETIKRGELQISSVLPINKAEYLQFLTTIQQRTSFILQKTRQKLFGQHFSDEGASSPYMARLFISILQIKDSAITDSSIKEKFDEKYHTIIMKFIGLRETYNEMSDMFLTHAKKVSDGSVVEITHEAIKVKENINRKYRKEFESLICETERILKHAMQELLNLFHINVGFLFKKQNAFERGVQTLMPNDPLLATYISEVRKWSEPLIGIRIEIEHKSWQLPDIQYQSIETTITANEPEVLGMPLSEYGKFIIDRAACFIEEILMHCFQKNLPNGISILEIPITQRNPEMPIRFRIGLVDNKQGGWQLKCNGNSFSAI